MKKKPFSLLTILFLNTCSFCSYCQSTSSQLIFGVIDADSTFNNQSMLDQKTAIKFLNYALDCYNKLAQLSPDKVQNMGNAIETKTDPFHREKAILGGNRYGMLVILYNGAHKSYLCFKCITKDGGNPTDVLLFKYDHNTHTGYLSNFRYPTKNHNGPLLSRDAMVKKLEAYMLYPMK